MRACEAYAQMHKTSEKYVTSTVTIVYSPSVLNGEHYDALPATLIASEFLAYAADHKPCRLAGDTNDQARSHHQSDDLQGACPHDPGIVPAACRLGDRIEPQFVRCMSPVVAVIAGPRQRPIPTSGQDHE